MLNRLISFVLLVLFAVLLTAMGGKGGGFERAPRVEKNFAVTITDASGNKISGDKFSWEGRIHFAGMIGMAAATVPFDKVKDISVGEKKDRKVKVTAHLKEGGETTMEIDADSRCFGESTFGSFMLIMEDIRSVVFP